MSTMTLKDLDICREDMVSLFLDEDGTLNLSIKDTLSKTSTWLTKREARELVCLILTAVS